MERRINIGGVVTAFDISDGKGEIPFSMSGLGTFRGNIDGATDHIFLYGEPDENTFYKHITILWHFTEFHIFQPKEQPFDVNDYYYKYWGTAKLVSIKE